MRAAHLALAGAMSVCAMPAAAALNPGARAPMFTTEASLAGKPFRFSLADALKKGPVVLYFYPAAFTSGCTVEAHEFAEATDDFAQLGATVVGMSADKIDVLNRFSKEECRDKFAVGAASPKVIKAYDVRLPVVAMSNRTSYVIAPDGRVIYAYSAMAAKGHVTNAMDAVKTWRATQHR